MRQASSVISDPNQAKVHGMRLNFLIVFLIICSLTLVLRLAYLQFAQYKRFATLSLKNQMNITPIAPTRGIIVDRNNAVLAENIPVYAIEIIPNRVKNLSETLTRLKSLLPSVTGDDIEHFQRIQKQTRSYLPVPFKLKLSEEEVAIFATHQYAFPGVNIKATLMRFYPLGDVTAHVLGYVGRLSTDDLNRVDNTNYRATNFIGKSGIERFYENKLHGTIGYQQLETDVSGRTVRTLSQQTPISGEKIKLTLDARLQTRIHDALNNKSGAVAVLEVTNGDVLALVSTPSYDPNTFVQGMTQKQYDTLINAPEKPLFHRAIRGLYPPASTIKPFIALAGINKGIIDETTTIYDPGWYRLPGISHRYRDFKRSGHGPIQLKRAITVSCDTYFYQLGNKLGINAIEDILRRFGFGQLSHIDLKEENSGIVPSPHWKKQMKALPWYPGDTVITAIGQGFMLASPLQLANATASLSQHGRRFRPHLLKEYSTEENKSHTLIPLEEYPVHLQNNAWNLITDSMHSVISKREGTGHRFGRDAPYSVAAKTGTAQVFSLSQDEKKRNQYVPDSLRDHSLFIAFAPTEKPEVAIAVLVEHDPTAPQIARKVMDAYFDLKKNEVTS
ncbi:MAG: penicillin-binding protein 2 [Gammaproteobacteria bacterium]|nr:penicillin-binding protein 2 [Gammaproteobacteria bacterium]MCH9762741.1 penicillin-binding protein 2 [Gammaproteobacteria bacterium]